MVRTLALSEAATRTGEVLGTSEWLLVDQDRVNRFAEATGDNMWVHVDVERATREIGGTIVHGCLTQSLIPYFTYRTWKMTGYARVLSLGTDKVRYTAPVRVGSRLRLTATLVSCEGNARGVRIVVRNVIEAEGTAEPVCVADSVTWFEPEDAAGSAARTGDRFG